MGKQLFTWLSLVVSLMASFVLSLFPLDVLDEIWDVIESVFEGCLTYSLVYSLKRDVKKEVLISSILCKQELHQRNGSSILGFTESVLDK